MSQWLADFHFLRPGWLFALLPLAILGWMLARRQQGRDVLLSFCDPALLPFVSTNEGSTVARRGRWPALLAALLAIVALAGPTCLRQPQPVFRESSALVVALDLSQSMLAEDLAPNRLARAVFKIRDLLAARQRGQTALVVFAGKPFVVTPLTDDTNTIVSQLETLTPELMPVQGSDVAGAIANGAALLGQAGHVAGDILLVTDGASRAQDALIAKVLKTTPYRVSVLAIGSPDGAPIPDGGGGFVKDSNGQVVLARLDAAPLRQIADSGHGRFIGLTPDGADVETLAQFFATQALGPVTQAERRASEQWVELGPWLLLPVLVLAALAFRRGALVLGLMLPLCLGLPRSAAAADWWLTPDQAGRRAFDRGEYGKAAEHFAKADWRAAALYRDGKYADAAGALKQEDAPDAHYNRGNALARAGELEAAVAAYDKALQQDPANDDARYNKGLIEDLLRRESQKQDDDKQDAARKQGGKQQQGDGQGDGDGGAGDAQSPSPVMPPEGGTGDKPNEARQDAARQQSGEQKEDGERTGDANGSAREDGKSTGKQGEAQQAGGGDEEARLSAEQWLRQVPDDPGGLWRRKFQSQYQRQYGAQGGSSEPW